MADWKKIEAEYLTGHFSYRDLAEKYGVSVDTVASRGKRGGWVGKRMGHEEGVRAEVLKADSEQAVRRTERLMEVADKLLFRVEELSGDAGISPASIKTLSEALKNIRDAQMIKSGKDLLEQQARIDKLQKECSRAETERGSVTVRLEGNVGEFAR